MVESCVADNIKAIIDTKGLKNKAVAAAAGYSVAQFSALMTKRRVIRDVDVMAIANALGVTPNDIFGINGRKDKNEKRHSEAD